MKKVAVFGSGNGSNFEAVVKYFENKDVEFVCISDKKDAYILERAKKLGVKHHHVPFRETLDFLKANTFDLIVLAGYMRILPKEVVEYTKIINIHPAMLPEFRGADAIERAYDAGNKRTGVTVHYVDEGVDTGSIIAQLPVEITEDMTLEQLETTVHAVEHKLYPHVIDHVLFNKPLGDLR